MNIFIAGNVAITQLSHRNSFVLYFSLTKCGTMNNFVIEIRLCYSWECGNNAIKLGTSAMNIFMNQKNISYISKLNGN